MFYVCWLYDCMCNKRDWLLDIFTHLSLLTVLVQPAGPSRLRFIIILWLTYGALPAGSCVLLLTCSSSLITLNRPSNLSHLQITNKSFYHTASDLWNRLYTYLLNFASYSAIIFYITLCHLSNSLSQRTNNSSLSFFFPPYSLHLAQTTLGRISSVLTLAYFITAVAFNAVKYSTFNVLYTFFSALKTSGGSRGGHPGRGPPPSALIEKKKFQVKEIISYGCASSANLYLFILRIKHNGQWAWPFILLRLCSRKSKFYNKLY